MMKKLFITLAILAFLAVPTVVFAHSQDVQSTVFYACENAQGKIDPNSITQNDNLLQSGSCTGANVVVQWSVTGPKGPQGEQGVQGDPGLKGDKGDPGMPGLDGKDGIQGPQGPAGKDGQDGAIGPQGLQGDLGPQGPKGDTGLTGPQGDPGVQGTPGPKGDKGDTGPAGLPFSHAACSEILTGPSQQENKLFCLSGIEPDGGLVYTAAINAAKVRLIVGVPISSANSVDWGDRAITYVSFTSGLHAEYHADNKVRFYDIANQQVF